MEPSDRFLATLQQWIEVVMHRSIHDLLAYARESGLSMAQIGVLFQIRHAGGRRVTDLGENLGVTSSAASQVLDRLVQQGLILRTEDPNDRRVKQLALSDKGIQVIERTIHAREAWLSSLGQNLSDSEKQNIIACLNVLIERINHVSAPAENDSTLLREKHNSCDD